MASRVMHLLGDHVPITLLLDLARPDGPTSREVLRAEGGSADWLVPVVRRERVAGAARP